MAWRPLLPLLTSRVPEGAARWFEETVQRCAQSGVEGDTFATAWSGLGRRFGRVPVSLTGEERAGLQREGAAPVPEGWALDEVGRGVLLLAAVAATAPARQPAVVADLFRAGELREQQAVLRTLSYLPEPERFAPVAVDAIRSNPLSVLEAIACENPYPAAHVADASFNQMVVKALFNGIPLARVVGLRARITPELVRMVSAFASERRAAGRPVPADVSLITQGSTNAAV